MTSSHTLPSLSAHPNGCVYTTGEIADLLNWDCWRLLLVTSPNGFGCQVISLCRGKGLRAEEVEGKVGDTWKMVSCSISLLRLPLQNTTQNSLKNRNLFYHTSGDWKSKVKVPVSLVSPESSLPTVSSHGSSHVWALSVSSSSYDTSLLGLRSCSYDFI